MEIDGSHTVDYALPLDLQMFAQDSEDIDDNQETRDEVNDDDIQEYLRMFGADEPEESQDTADDDEDEDTADADEDEETEEEPPAKEVKKVKVKFNKEEREVEVTDDNLPEFIEKSLALDKERERKNEYEKALNRAAKLAGYKDHADFVANLDKIEQEQIKKQQTELDQLQDKLLAELEENGVDRELAKRYLDNNPLVQQAKEAIAERERLQQEQKEAEKKQNNVAQWNALFKKYPSLVEEAGEDTPSWYTPDMARRVDAGYDPIDAYELAHRDTIVEQTKKQTEQATLKKQMLNKRSQVADKGIPQNEPEVPEELSTAFSLFGLSPKLAKKYIKK